MMSSLFIGAGTAASVVLDRLTRTSRSREVRNSGPRPPVHCAGGARLPQATTILLASDA